jgi:sugar phosphate isomerase/epimerase
MTSAPLTTRRTILGALAAAPFALRAASGSKIPVGLELYSVRDDLKKDPMATLQGVAKAGYDCVEFFAPYVEWTPEYAKQIKKQLDDLKLRCYSTHNGFETFSPGALPKAVELNKILDTHYIVMSSAGKVEGIDGWKHVADVLNQANETVHKSGLHTGYHNHDAEWHPIDGQRPMDVLAASTDKSVMLQFDVGTCVSVGEDPVAWIEKNPGRIRSLHLKDWGPQKKYRVLFGEGSVPWKQLFAAAEKTGGVEFYLIEQEGSDYPEMETAERCLVAFRDIHG